MMFHYTGTHPYSILHPHKKAKKDVPQKIDQPQGTVKERKGVRRDKKEETDNKTLEE